MEFKRLSDVEVVAEPTETANVLIEENGIVKKAPKAAVGGGMGGSLMVNIDGENATVDRTYDEIKEILDNGGVVLGNFLKAEIGYNGEFTTSLVTSNYWPLYFGILVETDAGEVIAFVPTRNAEDVPYLMSDNTMDWWSQTSGAPA